MSFARRALPIIRMKEPGLVAGPPLLLRQAEIIECGLIYIEPRAVSIRAQNIDVLRSEIEDLSKLAFALANRFFCFFGHGNVRHRAHKVEAASLHATTDYVNMLDCAIGHQ